MSQSKANNIECPRCGGWHCHVNEEVEGERIIADVKCEDCDFHEQEVLV